MTLLTADQLSKAFADRPLFQSISFSIQEGDKIGIVGVNGTGKSTLLKLVAGLEPADQGQILRTKGLRIEYLPQQPEFPAGATVLEAVVHGQSPILRLIREYEAAAALVAESPDDPVLQQRLIRLSGQMDDQGAFGLDSEIKSVLTQLGITTFTQPVESLSGGQKKRVALAAALVNPADLLILDEPTNHIDPATVSWLERYLAAYKGALLMVTHDRYFLERVTQILFEIDSGSLFRYDANYSNFLDLKAERLEREQASEAKRQNILRRELAWIRRGAKARSTKQQARIDRFETLSAVDRPAEVQSVQMTAAATRLGRKTLILDHISKAWADQTLFRDFSYILRPRERLGLIGPNGCGKTTLLRILAGQVQPDSGSREVGSTVKIGFFTQENEAMNPDLRVIEFIRETAEVVTTNDGELTASQMLERFLFPPALQWTPIRKLSGGEKRRLYLLSVLMGAPNVLLLDEPTNDLDITTLSVLEDYLDVFPGAVVVVSHDRYFLDRVVDRILAFEPGLQISQYEGDYEAYVAEAERREGEAAVLEAVANKRDSRESGDAPRPTSQRKLSFKMSEKIELAGIDERIAELETQLAELDIQLESAASDYLRLQELTAQREVLDADYQATVERWVYLNELQEKIENQR
jgi:ATP-binding cassette subfamily F protein uup